MKITVVTPPPFEPVTLASVMEHLRWDADNDSPAQYPLQTLVEGYITTAREYAERVTRRALVQQTLRITLRGFPSMRVRFGGRYDDDDDIFLRPGKIELPRPPFIALLHVKYLDSTETLQTLASSNYYVDSESDIVPQLVFRDTFDPGIACTTRQDAVRIEWQAGYDPGSDSPLTQEAAAANVPQSIKDAIKLQVQLLADRFDPNERAELERARDALLNGFKVHTY